MLDFENHIMQSINRADWKQGPELEYRKKYCSENVKDDFELKRWHF